MKKLYDDSLDFSDFFAPAPAQDLAGSLRGTPSPPPSVLGAPIDVPEEELEAEAAVTASGTSSVPGSTVAVGSSAGLTINLIFDNAAMAAPQSFRDGITQAMQMICAVVTDHITLNLQIDYSGTGKGAFGGPSGGNYVSYSTVHADLVNNASPGDTTFNSLPSGSTIAGQSQVAVWYSQEKLWGMISPTGNEIDGSASFATDIDPNLLIGVALHELTHAMGRVPYAGNSGQPDIFDFYRFTSPGNMLVNGNSTAPAAYFSLDGGAHKIADYGKTSDPSDFLNSGVQGSTDPFNEFYSNSTQQQLTAIDLKQLDALGFHLASNTLTTTTTVIEAYGATKLDQVGNNYFMDAVAANAGTGPELKYGGGPVTVGQYGSWTFIAAEPIANGYEVTLHLSGTDQYTVWDTDASGNVVGNGTGGVVLGSSTALEALEPSFQQDLNGDHVIGVPQQTTTVIEAYGATKLDQVGNNYFMDAVAANAGTGPELKYGGGPVTVGQYGSWTFIAAEPIANGYEVALHLSGMDQYTVWDTDASGNVVGNGTGGVVLGSSTALEALEPSFQQDLNGDHVIGVPPATNPAIAFSPAEENFAFVTPSIAYGASNSNLPNPVLDAVLCVQRDNHSVLNTVVDKLDDASGAVMNNQTSSLWTLEAHDGYLIFH